MGIAEISCPAVVVMAPPGQQQRWLQGARSPTYILGLVFSHTVSCGAVKVVTLAVTRQLEVKVSIGAALVDFLGELCWSGLSSAAGVIVFVVVTLSSPHRMVGEVPGFDGSRFA